MHVYSRKAGPHADALSFLFVNLMKPDVNDMFYKRFDAELVID